MSTKTKREKSPREKVINSAITSFYNTAIDARFIDVYLGGYYAAILDMSNGNIPDETIKKAGVSINRKWPKLQKPQNEHLYSMR